MKKFLALLLLSMIIGHSLQAQFYYYNNKYYASEIAIELGAGAGGMNAFTDLGGKKGIGKGFSRDLNWKNTKACAGFYALAMYRDAVGLRLQATFGQVAAYDSILKDVKTTTFGRYERNLSFKSSISDFQLALEIHPLFFKNYEENESPYFSPYIVAGVGLFSFDPQAKLNGQWYSLQPLRTEGQGFSQYPDHKPYQLQQINFAAGMGIRYEVNAFLNARLEINHRFLQTDYLDDVSSSYIDPAFFSNYLPAGLAAIAQQLYNRKGEIALIDITSPGEQRGNPRDKDAFFTIQLKLGITLGRLQR